ncbi:thioredoxin family protein [Lysinibacillus sp. 3P01SB]|uniref:thioredoxin family protein n=1 Tax=Lysinibacillus sp. 3P01SB TaxID=3132284 RepID=UPI0039A6A4C1
MIGLGVIITTLFILLVVFDSKKKTEELDNEITVEELQNGLLENEDYFVYFYQTDCLACKKTSPIVIPMTKKMNIDLKKINLQKDTTGWKEFKIKGTPTIIYFENGKEVDRIFAKKPEETFRQWFEKNSKGK